jgi:hypothetical protein
MDFKINFTSFKRSQLQTLTYKAKLLCWMEGANLGVVYTMDHEIVPRPCKICHWLLNSSQVRFHSHQGKNVKETLKFKAPKGHVLKPTLIIDMLQRVLWWERQKRCYGLKKKEGPMADKHYHY